MLPRLRLPCRDVRLAWLCAGMLLVSGWHSAGTASGQIFDPRDPRGAFRGPRLERDPADFDGDGRPDGGGRNDGTARFRGAASPEEWLSRARFLLNGDPRAPCSVSRNGNGFQAVNEKGTPTNLVVAQGIDREWKGIAANWNGLTGTLHTEARLIAWDDGAIWIDPESYLLQPLYMNGNRDRVARFTFHNGRFSAVNENGTPAPVVWKAGGTLDAPSWRLNARLVSRGFGEEGVTWGNGDFWSRHWFAGSFFLNGRPTAVCHLKRDTGGFLAVNEQGTSSRVVWSDTDGPTAVDWNLRGRIDRDAIVWSNGDRWAFAPQGQGAGFPQGGGQGVPGRGQPGRPQGQGTHGLPGHGLPGRPMGPGLGGAGVTGGSQPIEVRTGFRGDPTPFVRLVTQRGGFGQPTVIFARNDNDRAVVVTVLESIVQSGITTGQTTNDYLVPANREVSIGERSSLRGNGASVVYSIAGVRFR